MAPHPLSSLSAAEITASTALIRAAWPAGTLFQFKVVTLQEPPKAVLVPFLAAERAARAGGTGTSTTAAAAVAAPDRRVSVAYYLRNTDKFHEAVVNLTAGTVESQARVGPDMHGNADADEMLVIEKIAVEDPAVQAALARLQLPAGAVVVADPWIYGSDGVRDGALRDDRRSMQCFLYMRDPANAAEPDSNHYAFPLPVSPVVDCATLQVVRIDVLPTGTDAAAASLAALPPWTPAPPSEYLPEAQPQLRADLKPLRVVQPEGASFVAEALDAGGGAGGTDGRRLRWQKWELVVGFNQREGVVLYDVHYDGRPVFYRLSLSDMAIPYADPRHPFHKKQAFDLGDVGAGMMANNLQLGCDCLGAILYLDGVVADSEGRPQPMPNAVCVHEQDAGLAWKHTNYRTGRAVAVRQRELVVQTILTVANYEYVLAWIFNLAGDVAYEVRATGILSTQPADASVAGGAGAAADAPAGHPFGTVVHPGVLASHHQHFFSLRIDPMVAGHGNAVVYQDAVPLPRDAAANPHGVGYTLQSTTLAASTALDLPPAAGRVLHITNPAPAARHPVNGLPAAYKVQLPPMQPILADTASFHHRRAEFADHPVYVTRHADHELYAGGRWTNQSRGGAGVRAWAARRDSLAAGDPVVWLQFGLNHIPRAEDFPVMPCETLRVTLRPANFFVRNPALDVPPSAQAVNKSVLLDEAGQPAAANGCCA